MLHNLAVLSLALVIDRIVGDPDLLWKRLPHPIVCFGKIIANLDCHLNKGNHLTQFLAGLVTIIFGLITAVGSGLVLTFLCNQLDILGFIFESIIGSVFLAQKSLYLHVNNVAIALRLEGLEAARCAVSLIVGRDPNRLDEAGICRAAIESLAENSSDGVIAPAFWLALFGLPGLFAYKMVNTADSMIGHRTTRYQQFGFVAAKLDDLLNYLPARLTALLVVFSSSLAIGLKAAVHSWKVTKRDAKLHRSPNAGFPEAAYAGALNISLSGPRIYGGNITNEPYINQEGRLLLKADIAAALRLYNWSLSLFFACIVVLTAIAYF